MINWLKSTAERQKELLGLASKKTGLPAYAIEKDWWVFLALYAIFQTPGRIIWCSKAGLL